jgi:Na+-translocating ferredoxin:NAD+ oxidoreductase RnfC subunit
MRNPKLQDSSFEAERILIELTRKTPLWKRALQLSNLIQAQRSLVLAELQRRYPEADSDELKKRLAGRILPREDVIRVFNWDPEEQGY